MTLDYYQEGKQINSTQVILGDPTIHEATDLLITFQYVPPAGTKDTVYIHFDVEFDGFRSYSLFSLHSQKGKEQFGTIMFKKMFLKFSTFCLFYFSVFNYHDYCLCIFHGINWVSYSLLVYTFLEHHSKKLTRPKEILSGGAGPISFCNISDILSSRVHGLHPDQGASNSASPAKNCTTESC